MGDRPVRLCEHGKKKGTACGRCTAALWKLLDASWAGDRRLWMPDVDAFVKLKNVGCADWAGCRCGGSSLDPPRCDRSERSWCHEGKLTPLVLADRRCDGGSKWVNETVRLPGGKVADPADLSWQLRNTHGASKESLLVVALIKARSRQGESERTGRLFDC